MEIGEKIPIVDYDSKNGTKVCTLKEIVFECKFFRKWSLNEDNGYCDETLSYPKKDNKNDNILYEKSLEDWNIKLNILLADDKEFQDLKQMIKELKKR